MDNHKLQSVRGTKDLYGDDILRFNKIIEIAKNFANSYYFEELQTPIFEFSEIFERNLGEDSDILTKEVYKFVDRSNNSLTLRPEFTAAIVRAFIANGLISRAMPQKFFSYGPIFRYDRPQKGRQRQFHQINYEVFGAQNYYCDAELIILAQNILQKLGIVENVTLKISHLGCQKTKSDYAENLKQYFTKYKNELSEDSQIRLEKNPLRILDSKDIKDIKLFADAPKISEFYSQETQQNLADILNILEKSSINYVVDNNLVRGLDYYTGLVFEFVNDHDGAQNTILAGGRYDNLVGNMAKEQVAAVGFAAGVERLMLMMNCIIEKKSSLVVNYVSEDEKLFAFEIANFLRNNGLIVDFNYSGNFKRQMKKMAQKNYDFAIIIGDEEVKTKKLTIKNLEKGQESLVDVDLLLQFFS